MFVQSVVLEPLLHSLASFVSCQCGDDEVVVVFHEQSQGCVVCSSEWAVFFGWVVWDRPASHVCC